MPKPELEFFDPATVSEQQVAGVPGLTEKILTVDAETGDYTRILIFAPGTDTTSMGVQRHEFWEEVWIIEGALHDLNLKQTFSAGMYACRPPGMAHGPWISDAGCRTFEIRYHRREETREQP